MKPEEREEKVEFLRDKAANFSICLIVKKSHGITITNTWFHYVMDKYIWVL